MSVLCQERGSPVSPQSPFDVVLSYSRADTEAVEKLAKALRSQGLTPFIDQWYLRPGQSWQQELEQHLLGCRAAAHPGGPWRIR